jgi:hypothetical protein
VGLVAVGEPERLRDKPAASKSGFRQVRLAQRNPPFTDNKRGAYASDDMASCSLLGIPLRNRQLSLESSKMGGGQLDHVFENLGPDRFQQLVQALLISTNPRTVCFPIGQPDGGRDAIWPVGFDSGKEEFIVFQVKYSRQPATIENVSEWLREKAKGELEKIERLKSRGAKQYFLVTNVAGTAHLNSGSIDKTVQALRQEIGLPISAFALRATAGWPRAKEIR